jgi:hypothetical protein
VCCIVEFGVYSLADEEKMFLRSELPEAAFCSTSYVVGLPRRRLRLGASLSVSWVAVNSGILEAKSIETSLVKIGAGV